MGLVLLLSAQQLELAHAWLWRGLYSTDCRISVTLYGGQGKDSLLCLLLRKGLKVCLAP